MFPGFVIADYHWNNVGVLYLNLHNATGQAAKGDTSLESALIREFLQPILLPFGIGPHLLRPKSSGV